MFKQITRADAETLVQKIESALKGQGLKLKRNSTPDVITITGSISESDMPEEYRIKAAIDKSFNPRTEAIYKVFPTPDQAPNEDEGTQFKNLVLAPDPRYFGEPRKLGDAVKNVYEFLKKSGFEVVRTWQPYAELRLKEQIKTD